METACLNYTIPNHENIHVIRMNEGKYNLTGIINVNMRDAFVDFEFEIDQEKTKKLPQSAIYSIISNPNLRVSDEDSFLNFIVELYLNDRSYSDLFEYVIFNNVSKKTLKSFFSVFTYEDINMNIWHSICDLFTSKSNSNHSERYHINEKHLFYISEFKNDKFSGNMRYLNNNKKGNIHDNGTIKITSNSIYADCLHPKNLVDFDKQNDYQSKNEENIFIKFDFKDKQIQLSN